MKKIIFYCFIVILALWVPVNRVYAGTITTTGSGNWNSTTADAPWPGGTVPLSTDNVIISTGRTVTVTAAASITNLTLNAVDSKLVINSGQAITVSGTFSNSGTTTNGVVGPGTIQFTGAATFGSLTPSGTLPNVMAGDGSSTNTVTIGANTLVADLTVSANATLTNSTFTVGVSGNLSVSGTFTAGTGVYTLSGTTKTIGGGVTTVSIPSLTVNGTYTMSGSVTTLTVNTAMAGAGTWTQTTTGILNLGGTSATFTLVATAVGNTVNYTGAAQTVKPVAYHHLGLSGSGAKTITSVATIAGNFSLSGTCTASTAIAITIGGNLTVSNASGTGLTLAGFDFTVSGTTNISGTLTNGTTAGNKTFTGDVTVSGTWNESANSPVFFFGGNFTNNATSWVARAGVHTFSGTSKVLSGSTVTSIANVSITGTITNSGTLTVSTTLNGAGTLTNGDGSTGTLNYAGVGAASFAVGTFNASATGNTVNYTDTGAASTIKTPSGAGAHYYNLGIAVATRVASLAAAISVDNNLTITTGSLNDAGFQITGNASGTLSAATGTFLCIGGGATCITSSANATTFPTAFTTAHISLDPVSTVSYLSSAVGGQTISSTPTYGNLSIIPVQTAASPKTFASGTTTINGNFRIQPITGAFLLTVTMGGNIVVASTMTTTISKSNSASSKLVTTASNYGLQTGFLNVASGGTLDCTGSSSVIELTGTTSTALFTRAGTFTEGNSTVLVDGAADTTLMSGTATMHILTINTVGHTVTAGAVITIDNAAGALFYIQAGTFDCAVSAMAGSANGLLTMDANTTLKLGTAGAATLFPSAFTKVHISLNTTSTVLYEAGVDQIISNIPDYGNLVLTPLGVATPFFSLTTGATTVNNNFTLSAGSFSDAGFQLNGNANGLLTVGSNAKLCIGAASASCTASSANVTAFPTGFTKVHSSLDASSTVAYLSSGAAQAISSVPDYGNLSIIPVLTVGITKTFGINTTTIHGNFLIQPTTGSFLLTVNMGGDIVVDSSDTTTITGTTSTSKLVTTAGNYRLTTGFLNIGATGTLDATGSSSTIELTGISSILLTNGGAFTKGSSTVLVSGAGTPTLLSAATTFNNLTFNNSGGNYQLGANVQVDAALAITAGTINQSTYQIQAVGVTVGVSGIWSNLSTGDIVVGTGNVANAGSVIFKSGNTSCGGTDDIAITAISGVPQWSASGAGAYTMWDVSVTGQNAASAITVLNGTNGGSNTGSWTFNINCPGQVTVSGTVYTNEGSSNIGTGKTIHLLVDGTGSYTADTNGSGVYSISSVVVSTGHIVTVYISGESEKATTVYVSDGTGKSDVDLYQNRLIVRHDTGSSITNDNLYTGHAADQDIIYSVSGASGGSLTVYPGEELHIPAGFVFAPGGNVTVNTLHIKGTYTGGSETLTISGTGTGTSRPLYNESGTFTAPTTVTYTGSVGPAGFLYRKSHVITAATGAGTNYQVEINVHKATGSDSGTDAYLGTNVRDDFGDVRFTAADGITPLNYWREEYTSGSSAIFWVEVAADLSSSNTTIYLYYGNSGVTTTSNGTNTFPLWFDDFSTNTIGNYTTDGGTWAIDTGTGLLNQSDLSGGFKQIVPTGLNMADSSVLTRVYTGTDAPHYDFGVSLRAASGKYAEFFQDSGDLSEWDLYEFNPSPSSEVKKNLTAYTGSHGSQWHRLRGEMNSSEMRLYWDDLLKVSYSGTFALTSGSSGLATYETPSSGQWSFDYLAVRKFVYPEPAQSIWGSEEAPASGSDIESVSNYNNLTINGTETFNATAATTVTSDLVIATGTLALGVNNLNVGTTTGGGNIKVAGTISQSSSATTIVKTVGSGTNCIGANGTNCAGTPGTIGFYNLTIGVAGTTTTTDFAGDTGPNITVAGVLNITTNATLRLGATTSLVLSGAGTPITRTGTFNTTTYPGSTVTYTSGSGVSALSSAATVFYNLVINGTGTFTSSSFSYNHTVNGDLSILSGTLYLFVQNLSVGSLANTNSGSIKVKAGAVLSGGNITMLTSNGGSNCIGADGTNCTGTPGTIDVAGMTFGDATNTMTTVVGGTSPTITTNSIFIKLNATFRLNATTSLTLSSTNTAISNNGTFDATTIPGSTVTYTAGIGATLNSHAITFSNLTINGSGNFVPVTDITVQSAVLVSGGTLKLNANNLTVGTTSITDSGSVRVASGATISQTGGATTILSSASGTNCIGGSGASCSGTQGTIGFYNLTVGDSSTTFATTIAGTTPIITVGNDLKITTNATLSANGTVNVAHDWIREATSTFTANSCTINLNGGSGSTQTISGTNSFYILTATGSSARTIKFPSSVTTTVTNSLSLTGATGQLLALSPSTAATTWTITPPTGSVTVNFVNVTYSTTTVCINATNSSHSNTTGWNFDSACGAGNNAPDAPSLLFINERVTGAQSGELSPVVALGDGTPVFSAQNNDPDTGDFAGKYRLVVYSDSGCSSVVWDSDPTDTGTGITACMEGDRCNDITFAGSALPFDGSTYYWKIKYWDTPGGLAGPFSACTDTSFTILGPANQLRHGNYFFNNTTKRVYTW